MHFLDPEHEIYRRIIQAGQGYEDVESILHPYILGLPMRLLKEFSYLGEDKARKLLLKIPRILRI